MKFFPIAESVRYTTFNWSRKIETIPSVEITREEAIQDAVERFRELGCTFLRESPKLCAYSNVFQSHTIKRKHPKLYILRCQKRANSFLEIPPSLLHPNHLHNAAFILLLSVF